MMNSTSLNSIKQAIDHWNECRIPILRISYPDENHIFKGAMRFYFQDAGQKVATKCVNVTSAQTTKQVINILIEKFRPDMRMLSVPEYGLYEIHENGDERKLDPDERPLQLQLNWNQDDRDGRFLLRKIAEKSHDLTSQQESSLKKETNSNSNNNNTNGNNIAAMLYHELPETSFTRSISNPEAVMKRRRAQKLEKKLHDLFAKGDQDGGTLRIFGEAIDKKVSYKTLLLSTKDKASTVVKQVLEKYGKENEDPAKYCLVCVVVASLADGNTSLRESILLDDDCPLLINQNHDNNEGVLTFHVRPRTHKSNGTLPRQFSSNPNNQAMFANNNNNHIQNNNHNNSMKQFPQQMVQNNHIMAGPQSHSLPQLPPPPPQYVHATSAKEQILPALIQVKEDVEDIFLSRVITHVEPTDYNYRLTPTYILYMVSRYRASTLFHPELDPPSRALLFKPFTKKIATMIRSIIEIHKAQPAFLAFWLANSSDLNHFYKQDKHLSHFTIDAQKILYESITASFQYLLHCKQLELDGVLHTFFAETDDHGFEGDLSSNRSFSWEEVSVSISPILNVLNETMSSMRRNRVNAALTIQIFSHLFHHISRWLFDRLIGVYDRHLNGAGWQANFVAFCNREWGEKLHHRLAMICGWAERQGLEQAADFHLARVTQVTMFLAMRYHPRISPQDVREAYERCDRLNPVQLRALLQRYQPEQPILRAIIDNVLFSMDYTGEYPLEEDFDLKIPFLIPDDGYSTEMPETRGIHVGILDFVSRLSNIRVGDKELCIFTVQSTSSGFWNVYFKNNQDLPEIITIQLRKKNNSMGLSIIAARSHGGRLGIYIKNVVKNGAAAMDGRLQAGDQLLEVDGHCLVGIEQDAAAELMQRTGPFVTIKISKQAALYHGIADIINSVPTHTVVAPPILAPPPSFAQPPPRDLVRQAPIPDRRQIPPPPPPAQMHPPTHLVDRYPAQPEIRQDPRMMQFQDERHAPNQMDKYVVHHVEKAQQQMNHPERQAFFQPPPPSIMFDEPIATPPTHSQNATSPLKSPKKVSWVDTQPHQSLHTLIPPSPAPLPSPTAQEPMPPTELSNGRNHDDEDDVDYDYDYDEERVEENGPTEPTNGRLQNDTDEDQFRRMESHQLQPQQHFDVEDPDIIQQQQQQQQPHQQQQPPQPPNGQLDTTTESLTLDDINEVLSNETHNDWIDDSSGVIGTQEVYTGDPRLRIVKERERPNAEVNIEKLSFQEKLKMFNISAKK